MNIAVVGKGAREDAIAQKLIKENNTVYLINENNVRNNNIDIKVDDFSKIKEFCIDKNIKLVIIGPEDLLVKGIVDYFEDTDIRVFGPKKEYSKLESSKIYAKNFMKRNKVQTAEYMVFEKFDEKEIIKVIKEKNGNMVLKYDGLAAGKGVLISNNIKTALNNLNTLKSKYGNNLKLIIEDKLFGKEISVMSVTDGKDIKLFQAVQDYKLSHNNNKGLNTGGMGAITPLNFINDEILDEINTKIITPTLNGFKKENINYMGFLYFGIILTSDGPHLLEYNIRLGDPETQVLLPAMKSNLTNIINNALDNKLSETDNLKFENKYYISLVLASKGYPLQYNIGEKITFNFKSNKYDIFYAGVKKNSKGELLTNGGRVINIVASDSNLKSLKNTVYKYANEVNFKDKYYRDDIGKLY